MTPKQIAENYRLAARAIDEGIKIRHVEWGKDNYIAYHALTDKFYNDDNSLETPSFNGGAWQEYKEPAKLVTWYRPRVVWREKSASPYIAYDLLFRRNQDSSNWFTCVGEKFKVLEWESIQAPETYEQVGDE